MHRLDGQIGGGSLPGRRRRPGRTRRGALPALLLVLATAGGAHAGEPATRPAGPAGPMPLVETDEEWAGYLAEARQRAGQGDADAVRILQKLAADPQGAYVSAGGGRHVPLSAAAHEAIGQLDERLLRHYRQLYDAQARALYEEALRTGRTDLLRRLVRCYLHTSWGGPALDALGAACFDTGRFVLAAEYWGQAFRLEAMKPARAMLLAKIALARHLAGDEAEARRSAGLLKQRYPGAAGTIAGRRQDLAAFLARAMSVAPATRPDRRDLSKGWPGLGGVPDGLAVMGDCDVVLSPGWRHPPAETAAGAAPVKLLAGRSVRRLSRRRDRTPAPSLRKGQVQVSMGGSSPSDRATLTLSPCIAPVVVDDKVIYRTDEAVIACDLLTGDQVWSTGRLLPLAGESESEREGYFPYDRQDSDAGEYVLTAGGGKVFVRCGFGPSRMPEEIARRGRWSDRQSDTSALAAVEASSGGLLWLVGNGKGDDEVVRDGKFVSPPACHEGRLYAIVLRMKRYHLVCLDAVTGRCLWRTDLCQAPVLVRDNWSFSMAWASGVPLERCSPPAVADGRVFAAPNVGVVVALEADTGSPLWAFHYASRLNVSPRSGGAFSHGESGGPATGINPLIVSCGRVLCLPADSDSLVALACEDGRPVAPHGVARHGQADLTAIDADRLLLSGPGLEVLSAADGRRLLRAEGVDDVAGRPAVTPTRALACGRGVLHQLDLGTHKLTRIDAADPRSLLGNLLSVGDALIASNAAGVCAYVGFQTARQRLDERLARAAPSDRAELLLKRVRLAFHAGELAAAEKDLAACGELAERSGDAELRRQVATWAFRTCVAAGNRAATAEQMRAMFEKALLLADGEADRGETLLRLAKCRRQAGEFAAAAALAQDISDSHAPTELVDVPIGPEGAAALPDLDAPRLAGKRLAQLFIEDLIARHGRGVYAAFDARAAAALDKARADDDPEAMRAVWDRWPNSASADDALFAAAEAYYARATGRTGPAVEQLLAKALGCLSEVSAMGDSPLRISAAVGTAAIYTRAGNRAGATLMLLRLRADSDQTPVKFADIAGPFGAVVAALRQGKLPPAPEDGKAGGRGAPASPR